MHCLQLSGVGFLRSHLLPQTLSHWRHSGHDHRSRGYYSSSWFRRRLGCNLSRLRLGHHSLGHDEHCWSPPYSLPTRRRYPRSLPHPFCRRPRRWHRYRFLRHGRRLCWFRSIQPWRRHRRQWETSLASDRRWLVHHRVEYRLDFPHYVFHQIRLQSSITDVAGTA